MSNDPKYLGIPNINFSNTDKDDDREPEFSKQRIDRGFDDSESWSFDITMAKFIASRLRVFKYTYNEEICDKIILALDFIIRDEGLRKWNKEETEQVRNGLKLLGEYFLTFWNWLELRWKLLLQVEEILKTMIF